MANKRNMLNYGRNGRKAENKLCLKCDNFSNCHRQSYRVKIVKCVRYTRA